MEEYINETNRARAAVSEIVQRITEGVYGREIDLDIETAPIRGLEGYPGARRERVAVLDPETKKPKLDENGEPIYEIRFVKADKKEYLLFCQRVWRGSFSPLHLQGLGLHLPPKTTSGNVGDQTAGEAWKLFLDRVYELESTEKGRQRLDNARWTPERWDRAVENLHLERADYLERIATAEAEIATKRELAKTKKVTGIATLERLVKKLNGAIERVDDELTFLKTYAYERIEYPLDLRLITHVLKVGVEGRIHLDGKSGRNRIDPVQPGLDPYTSDIFLVQFTFRAPGVEDSYIFNINFAPVETLLPILELKKVRFSGANIKFDLKHLMHKLGSVYAAPREVFCTRVGSRIYYLGLKRDHSLLGATKNFLKGTEWPERIDKGVRNDFIGQRMLEPTPEMLQYAHIDTEVLGPLREAILEKADKYGQRHLVEQFSRLSWIFAVWELNGYLIDIPMWLDIAANAAAARDEVARELEQMLLPPNYEEVFRTRQLIDQAADELEEDYDEGDDDDDDARPAVDTRRDAIIRISQRDLVLGQLSRVLGLDFKRVFGKKPPSIGKDGRAAMERAYRAKNDGATHPFFYKYNLWSKLAKQASTYGKKFLWHLHPLTGRVHTTFNIAGTDTGRPTSTGPNLLNIPAAKEEGDADFRGAFKAPDGYYLLGADYEAMEFRIAGDVSRDETIRTMVEAGADPHAFTAANMWHLQVAEVAEPVLTEGVFRSGNIELTIPVHKVPAKWSLTERVAYAASAQVINSVMVVSGKTTRKQGKTYGFAWMFRGSAYGVAAKSGLPIAECEGNMALFSKVYKTADDYLLATADRVNTHVIENNGGTRFSWSEGYGGIRRWVELPPEPRQRDYGGDYYGFVWAQKEYLRRLARAGRQLANLPMQGGNAVVTTDALLMLVERGLKFGVLPWLSIYDENIVIAPETTPPQRTKLILESCMLEAADRYMTFVPAGTEADVKKVGDHWVKS